ncbi:MAG: cation:proton antiporter [Verrucomicrobiales bacterium]
MLAIAAVLAYVNYKFIRLPHTIGLMLLSLVISLLLVLIGQFFPGIEEAASKLVAAVDFDEVLMEIMLGYLLFAGSLHVNLNDLAKQKFVIGLTATLGVVISTFLVGGAAFC